MLVLLVRGQPDTLSKNETAGNGHREAGFAALES